MKQKKLIPNLGWTFLTYHRLEEKNLPSYSEKIVAFLLIRYSKYSAILSKNTFLQAAFQRFAQLETN